MTFIIPKDSKQEAEIEAVHNELATEHGRDNVLVTEVENQIVSLTGDGIGLVDPVSIRSHTEVLPA